MRKIIGVIISVSFIALAVYVGLWQMFIGGIIQGIDAIKITPVDSGGIAIGVVKVIFASFVGYVIAYIGIIIGAIVGGFPLKKKRKFGRK